MANVRWTLRAAIDLQAIFEFIGEHNASAALEIVRKVRSAALGLAEHPRKGREGRKRATRELVVLGTPYLIIYRVESATVEVLRVLHGRQNWPV